MGGVSWNKIGIDKITCEEQDCNEKKKNNQQLYI